MRACPGHQKRQAVSNVPQSRARPDTVCQRKGWCQPPPGTGGAELGSEWEEHGSEPGPGQLCLGVPQSDEPVGLPPARQQSPVRGGVKRPMCGFPCKQHLELQRKARVSPGCQGSGCSHTPLTVAAELTTSMWLYRSLIPLSPETVRKHERYADSTHPCNQKRLQNGKGDRRFGMQCEELHPKHRVKTQRDGN